MLKARDNPLASDRVERLIRYRPLDGTWDDLLARLDALNWRAAIVGPKGSGKTTLLEDLADRLAFAGRRSRLIRLSSEDGRIDPTELRGLASDEVLFIDGAEQLSPWRWMAVRSRARRAAGLVITTHAPGRLPTLIETRTTPELLGEILGELLGACPEAGSVKGLFARHDGNVREAVREIYDELANRRGYDPLAPAPAPR